MKRKGAGMFRDNAATRAKRMPLRIGKQFTRLITAITSSHGRPAWDWPPGNRYNRVASPNVSPGAIKMTLGPAVGESERTATSLVV
jgi:hypothetical protein